MKFQYKYILPALAALMISVSCDDDEKKPFDDFQQGAIPLFAPGDDDTGFIDLNNVDNSRISFELGTEGAAAVQSVDVVLTYNNSVTGENTNAKYSTVTSLPSTVTINVEQLLSAFPEDVLTFDSLDIGDSFTVNGFVLTTDGRYLDGGYSPSVLANKTVLLNYNVACASDLNGTYSYSTTDVARGDAGSVAGCGGTTTGTGKLEALGGGRYSVSDATFGVFGCAYGDTPVTSVALQDVCDDIAFTGADQYGDTYSLTVVSNDGTALVIDWENTYGDKGRSTLTRTDGKQWPLGLH